MGTRQSGIRALSCNNGPLWAKKEPLIEGKITLYVQQNSSEQTNSEKRSKCEQSDHRRKWNSTVADELEKFLCAVAGSEAILHPTRNSSNCRRRKKG